MSFDKDIAIASAEICTGLAASFLANGSDGVYLYNFFCDPDDIVKPQIHPYVRNIKTINAVSESEKIYDYPIRFAVINQEDTYISDAKWSPLPFSVSEEKESIEIITGTIPKNKNISLIIGYKMERPTVSVNGQVCESCCEVDLTYIPGIGLQPPDYVDSETVCARYELENADMDEHMQSIMFSSVGESEIVWVELDVI